MKESQHIYVQLEMQFLQNVRPECEFPAFCEALHAEASNGAEYRLEKIMFFFFYPWFLLSESSEPFCLKHKRCTVREANGSICPDRMFFSSSLFLIFPMRFTGKKILNWYLTILFAVKMPCSCYTFLDLCIHM